MLYAVVSPRESAYDDHGLMMAGGFEALVGRDEEIGLLLRRWEQSKEGQGQVVLISGEAGLGKSSLVEGLRAHAQHEGYTQVAFRCSQYTQQSALYPVIEHLQRVFDWQRDDYPETKLTKLESILAKTSLPHEESVPLIAALLALPLPDGRYPALTLTPQQQRQQTQDTLVAWLLEEAERQPLLAVWEDLHWGDPSTLELLGLFIEQAATVPMMNVLAFRPEFTPPWPTHSHLTPINLNRLERLHVEALVSRLARGKDLPSEVMQHVVSRTDGVPLYVEELTKTLLESDLLEERAETYVLNFPDIVDMQPELVAHHYTECGFAEQAVAYWQRAGQRALQGSAYAEGIAHLTQGLTVLTTQPETPVRLQSELDLHVALGAALISTKGNGDAEVQRVYTRAQELCEQIGNSPQVFPVLRGLILHYLARGQLQTTMDLGEELLRRAESQPDPTFRLLAHFMLIQILFYRGAHAAAQVHATQALEFLTSQERQTLVVRYGADLNSGAHNNLAWTLWYLGYPDQALHHSQLGCTLAQEISHPNSLATALVWSAFLHQWCGEPGLALEQAEAAIALATEQGFTLWLARGTALHGWALAMQGESEVGIAEIRQGLAAELATGGGKLMQPYFLGLLAQAYEQDGRPEAGLHVLEEALVAIDATTGHFYMAELHRLKGALLMGQADADVSQVEVCYLKALEIARAQEAKSLELQAATSLSRLWQKQGQKAEAHQLLAPIYDWFTEKVSKKPHAWQSVVPSGESWRCKASTRCFA